MVRLIDANDFSEQCGNYYAEEGPAEGFIGTVGELIAKQPTIEAEPVRHGRWIPEEDSDGDVSFVCSDCSRRLRWDENFCPTCGAKMDG